MSEFISLLEYSDSFINPLYTIRKHCWMMSQEEAEANFLSPRNCQAVEVPAETGQKRKRKADTETETPSKRQRTDISNTGQVTKVTVIDLTKTSDEELTVKQAPTMKKKRNVCKPRRTNETSSFSINTSRGELTMPKKMSVSEAANALPGQNINQHVTICQALHLPDPQATFRGCIRYRA